MKLKSILAALLLMVAGLQTAMAQKMIVTLNDNSKVTYSISQVKEVTFVEADEPVNDEHEYVDLGLPSGTMWATCNVGASKPEEYGDYFAWGETAPKDYYDWSTYLDTYDNGSSFKKYRNNGGLTELLPEDDAATANWGSPWRMPSLDQLKELLNISYTTTEWTTLNDVYGRKITSKSNGNSIFLPAAGYRWNDDLNYAGSNGDYWSSSLGPDYDYGAYGMSFHSDGWSGGRYYRDGGQSVRAVCP